MEYSQQQPREIITESGRFREKLNTSADDFLKEVAQPTTPAIESNFAPPPPGASPAQEGPVYTPPDEKAKPVFPGLDDELNEAEPAAAQPKVSKGYEDKVLMGIIKGEDYITATITALVAGEENIDQFRASDDDCNDLLDLMEPFREWIIDKCPHALPLILCYGVVKTKQIRAGAKYRKINRANRQASEPVKQRVANVINFDETRTNYVLYSDGYYRSDRRGAYVKRTEKHLLERPSINDLDKILAVKVNRNRDILATAFGWSEAEFNKYQIEE